MNIKDCRNSTCNYMDRTRARLHKDRSTTLRKEKTPAAASPPPPSPHRLSVSSEHSGVEVGSSASIKSRSCIVHCVSRCYSRNPPQTPHMSGHASRTKSCWVHHETGQPGLAPQFASVFSHSSEVNRLISSFLLLLKG